MSLVIFIFSKIIIYESILKNQKIINYDFQAKSNEYKFSKEFKLKTLTIDQMPSFLQQNVKKYNEWFDFEK